MGKHSPNEFLPLHSIISFNSTPLHSFQFYQMKRLSTSMGWTISIPWCCLFPTRREEKPQWKNDTLQANKQTCRRQNFRLLLFTSEIAQYPTVCSQNPMAKGAREDALCYSTDGELSLRGAGKSFPFNLFMSFLYTLGILTFAIMRDVLWRLRSEVEEIIGFVPNHLEQGVSFWDHKLNFEMCSCYRKRSMV